MKKNLMINLLFQNVFLKRYSFVFFLIGKINVPNFNKRETNKIEVIFCMFANSNKNPKYHVDPRTTPKISVFVDYF